MLAPELVERVIREHQPHAGPFDLGLICTCGADFDADHQLKHVTLAVMAAGREYLARL